MCVSQVARNVKLVVVCNPFVDYRFIEGEDTDELKQDIFNFLNERPLHETFHEIERRPGIPDQYLFFDQIKDCSAGGSGHNSTKTCQVRKHAYAVFNVLGRDFT
jgi:hypothetical protein